MPRCDAKRIWPARGTPTLSICAALSSNSTTYPRTSSWSNLSPARWATMPSTLIGTRARPVDAALSHPIRGPRLNARDYYLDLQKAIRAAPHVLRIDMQFEEIDVNECYVRGSRESTDERSRGPRSCLAVHLAAPFNHWHPHPARKPPARPPHLPADETAVESPIASGYIVPPLAAPARGAAAVARSPERRPHAD
jgi:hypothetical protein